MATRAGRRAGSRGQPAAPASDAGEWLEIARHDIKVMDLCYENELYGASAYHCQQALEKIVKFAVSKYKLASNPASLNHDVIEKLLEQWEAECPPEFQWAEGGGVGGGPRTVAGIPQKLTGH